MMINGTSYVNVHTTQFPGGEIRGQIGNAPVLITFTALLGNNEVPASNSTASGQATFTLSADGLSMHYVVQVANVVNATMSHIHAGAAGVNGGIVVLLFPVPPATAKVGSFTGILAEGDFTAANFTGSLVGQPLSTLIAMMINGTSYVNVHTTQFPGGEIRGQIGNQFTSTSTPTTTPTPTPTPSPTPSISPTPNSTQTPTPSPTPKPTSTPTTTPTQSPIVSPTPTESVIPSPTPNVSSSNSTLVAIVLGIIIVIIVVAGLVLFLRKRKSH
jgi:cell division septation protein DedD